jgi:hypothetical protein
MRAISTKRTRNEARKISRVTPINGSKVQGFRGSRGSGSEVQEFKGSKGFKVQGFTVRVRRTSERLNSCTRTHEPLNL